MALVESAGITDVGKKRKGNEDFYFLDDDMRLYVVSDGMGGHAAGEVASRMVVETLRDYMKKPAEEFEDETFTDFDSAFSNQANRLLSGIHIANSEVYQLSASNESLQGMGATVSAILLTDNKMIVGNVGDSPIYLMRNNTVKTISVPHTMMAEHAALAGKDAKPLSEQYRHVLTRAMGVEPTVRPDISEIEFSESDIVLICSDGLSDKVSPEEILDVVTKGKPKEVCKSLVDMANDRGGDDNITIIIFTILNEAGEYPSFAIEEDTLKVPEDDTLVMEDDTLVMEDDTLEMPDDVLLVMEDDTLEMPDDVLLVMEDDTLEMPDDVPLVMENDTLEMPDDVPLMMEGDTLEMPDDVPLVMEDDTLEMPDETPPKKTKLAADYDTDEVSQRGLIQNLSLEGVFIESEETFTIGEEIMLTFTTEDTNDPFMITGTVASRGPQGIDVKFEKLTPEQEEKIKSLF
ncbi:protein phosphatase 2C domain-containing protein [Thermodesulfobacteriota bacterium]